MIELFLALLIIPAVTIAVWDRVVNRLSVNAKRAYRLTGYVGVPVHELSHAIVCILFGMRIKKISFYKPNSASGTMGFVDFRYSPLSVRHGIGLALQGLAPLLAGACLVVMLLDSFEQATSPGEGAMAVIRWLPQVIGAALDAAYAKAFSGWSGTAAVLFALVISMHAIPSAADVLLGLRGLIMLIIFTGGVVLVVEMSGIVDSQLGAGLSGYIWLLQQYVEKGLWLAIYAAVTMVTLAVVGGGLLILLPSVVAYGVDFVRGAQGKI